MITLDPKSFKRKKSMLDSIDAELSQAKQLVISLKNTGNRGLNADMKKKKDMLIQKYEDYVKRYNTEEKVLVEWNKTLSEEDRVDLGKTEQRIQARETESARDAGKKFIADKKAKRKAARAAKRAAKTNVKFEKITGMKFSNMTYDDVGSSESGTWDFKSIPLGFAPSTMNVNTPAALQQEINRAEYKKGGGLKLFSAEDRAQMELDNTDMAENIKVMADDVKRRNEISNSIDGSFNTINYNVSSPSNTTVNNPAGSPGPTFSVVGP